MATPIPANHAAFRLDEVVAAIDGTLVIGPGPGSGRTAAGVADVSCNRVSTDTRDVTPGALFVALAGERFDGHDYAAAAIERGARVLVTHRELDAAAIGRASQTPGAERPAIVRVDDTRVALGRLALAHRLRWAEASHPAGPRRLLAITGSAGKTTTKILTSRLLEAAAPGQVHASVGNLNNEVGVPMTLFGLESTHRFAVVEVGTSRRGEIERLARIVCPDAAILTLVAAAHTEGLGTIEDVALEKGDLLAAVSEQGTAVANGDDPRARAQLVRSPARVRRTYGFAQDAVYRVAEFRAQGATGAEVVIDRPGGCVTVSVPVIGRSGALGAAAALGAVEALLGRPIEREEVARGWADLGEGLAGRLKPVRLADDTLVLDDTYNANPASMRSSVEAAHAIAHDEGRRLVLVLGEMRELGSNAQSEHHALGRFLEAFPAAFVLGIGGAAEYLVSAARDVGRRAEFAQDVAHATARLSSVIRPGDVVLVKGSRGVRTEGVVTHLVTGGASNGANATGGTQ